MDSSQTIAFKKLGFDPDKYAHLQKEKILERIDLFRAGKLYIEIGGQFMFDPHAARVLPGFDPEAKKKILFSLKNIMSVLYCANYQDFKVSRVMPSTNGSYPEVVKKNLTQIEEQLGIKPTLVITLCDQNPDKSVEEVVDQFSQLGYTISRRYIIDGYDTDIEKVLSAEGFGADDHVANGKKLILVTGPGSKSGKLSTCLGQIYQDHMKREESGYAKYELFPIWSLPVAHPVNLAYEAATADIGDVNVEDPYHMEAYGQRSVNYNRDIEAFKLIKEMTQRFVSKQNGMWSYHSPTDMGINYAGFAITDDQVVCIASLAEIERRADWYSESILNGKGEYEWVTRCERLRQRALKYIHEQGYSTDLKLL